MVGVSTRMFEWDYRVICVCMSVGVQENGAPQIMAGEFGGWDFLDRDCRIPVCANLPHYFWKNQMVLCTRCCDWHFYCEEIRLFCREDARKNLRFAHKKTRKNY